MEEPVSWNQEEDHSGSMSPILAFTFVKISTVWDNTHF